MNCEDYKPGPTMGKKRPVCKFFNVGNDTCSHEEHLFCEYIVLQELGEAEYIKFKEQDKKKRTRGGLGIKCPNSGKWELRSDCFHCNDRTPECGV